MEKKLDQGFTVLDVDFYTVFIARKFRDLRSSYGYSLGSKRYEGFLDHQPTGRPFIVDHRSRIILKVTACATAHVADNTFQWLIQQFDGRMIVLSDTGFHAAEGDPSNLKLCQRGEWQDRMLVETVLSMLTLVCHCKKVMHRGWAYFQARLAFTMAAFNVLVQWHGFQPNASGFVPLSIAEFSL